MTEDEADGWTYILLGGMAAVVGIIFLLLVGCITIKRPEKVETFGGFLVTGIEGGSSTPPSAGWLSDVTSFLGSLSWLAVVGAVIFLLVAWKLPWLFRKIKETRAARAALPQRRRS